MDGKNTTYFLKVGTHLIDNNLCRMIMQEVGRLGKKQKQLKILKQLFSISNAKNIFQHARLLDPTCPLDT